eukprot:sb/3463596/
MGLPWLHIAHLRVRRPQTRSRSPFSLLPSSTLPSTLSLSFSLLLSLSLYLSLSFSLPAFYPQKITYMSAEPTGASKQPIRTRYLGHVTGYQLIRDQYFLTRSVHSGGYTPHRVVTCKWRWLPWLHRGVTMVTHRRGYHGYTKRGLPCGHTKFQINWSYGRRVIAVFPFGWRLAGTTWDYGFRSSYAFVFLWLQFMAAIYVCNLWLQFMAAIYGCNLWLQFLAAIYGCYLWLQFMAAISSFAERSRNKTEGTRVISVLELETSRDKNEGTRVISVFELVGVDTGIKSLSHLPLRNGLETFHWCHFVGNGQVMGGRLRTFKLYFQPFSRYLDLKIELKSPTSTPHNLAIAYKMAPDFFGCSRDLLECPRSGIRFTTFMQQVRAWLTPNQNSLFSHVTGYQPIRDQFFLIRYCIDWTTFPVQPPDEVDKIWTFRKTATTLSIECNGVEVLNYQFSDGSETNCAAWGGPIGKEIAFMCLGFTVDGSVQGSWDDTDSGQTVTINCQENHVRDGSRDRTCSDGEWDKDAPLCRQLDNQSGIQSLEEIYSIKTIMEYN